MTIHLKGHNTMANHVAKILPPIQPPISSPKYRVHRTREDWARTNKTTGEVIIQPGKMNAVIYPETGKHQEYRNLMKGHAKPKWTRATENYIERIFQGVGFIEDTDTCFSYTDTRFTNTEMSPTAT